MTAPAPARATPCSMAGPDTTAGPDATSESPGPAAGRVLVVGCGALARELRQVASLNVGLPMDVECLPAKLHNRPERIAPAVRKRVQAAKAAGAHRTILVGYMDCGTGGELDRVCAEEDVPRLPGVHCYELYAGAGAFAELHDAEPGTFYLTDYLVRHFDRLIMQGLGIAEHPELLEAYFGNYTRVVHLAQTDDPSLARAARQAAARLGLRCERIVTGIDGLRSHLVEMATARPATTARPGSATRPGSTARPGSATRPVPAGAP